MPIKCVENKTTSSESKNSLNSPSSSSFNQPNQQYIDRELEHHHHHHPSPHQQPQQQPQQPPSQQQQLNNSRNKFELLNRANKQCKLESESSKLINLNKKFDSSLSSSSSSKFNDPITTNCKQNSSPSQISTATASNKIVKRLSCEELENLKERFVDFIKLEDANCSPSSISSSTSSPSSSSSSSSSSSTCVAGSDYKDCSPISNCSVSALNQQTTTTSDSNLKMFSQAMSNSAASISNRKSISIQQQQQQQQQHQQQQNQLNQPCTMSSNLKIASPLSHTSHQLPPAATQINNQHNHQHQQHHRLQQNQQQQQQQQQIRMKDEETLSSSFSSNSHLMNSTNKINNYKFIEDADCVNGEIRLVKTSSPSVVDFKSMNSYNNQTSNMDNLNTTNENVSNMNTNGCGDSGNGVGSNSVVGVEQNQKASLFNKQVKTSKSCAYLAQYQKCSSGTTNGPINSTASGECEGYLLAQHQTNKLGSMQIATSCAAAVAGTAAVSASSRLSSRLSVVSAESSSAESSLSSASSTCSNRPEPPQRTVSIRNSSCIYSSPAGILPKPNDDTLGLADLSMINNNSQNESCYSRPESFISLNQQRQANRIQDDCVSIKSSSIYSSCRSSIVCGTGAGGGGGGCGSSSLHGINQNQVGTGIVRSSRSVFSIYEEEDESCAGSSSSSSSSSSASSSSSSAASTKSSSLSNPSSALSSSSSPSSSANNLTTIKLERLNDFEIKKIESMYGSIGCIVLVGACTCDFYTTTSEQIANLLNDCWHLELNSIVPVWLFDTGFNPKRPKQLRLLLVDRFTAFPLATKPIIINKFNKLKNPNNDKRVTFTLKNKQLVCLIHFYDFFSCQEFFKFYADLSNNPRHANLFRDDLDETNMMFDNNNHNHSHTNSNSFINESSNKINSRQINGNKSRTDLSKIKLNETNKKKSRSMLSLSKTPTTLDSSGNKNSIGNKNNKSNRYSEVFDLENSSHFNMLNDLNSENSKMNKMKACSTSTNIKRVDSNSQTAINEPQIRITGITKHCISNPCAFQHINSLKDGDHHIKMLIENNTKITESCFSSSLTSSQQQQQQQHNQKPTSINNRLTMDNYAKLDRNYKLNRK